MPERRDLKKYPKEYFQLFLSLYSKDEVYIKASSPNQAGVLRRDLYNFRTAIREELQSASFIALANEIMINLSGSTLKLHRHKNLYTNLISEALNK